MFIHVVKLYYTSRKRRTSWDQRKSANSVQSNKMFPASTMVENLNPMVKRDPSFVTLLQDVKMQT